MRHKPLTLLVVIGFLLSLFIMQWLMPSAGAQRKSPPRQQPTPRQPATPKKGGGPIGQLPGEPIDATMFALSDCCGKKPPLKLIPNYSTSTYASFTGQIAVATNMAGGVNDPSVVIWDLKNQNQGGVPLGSEWNGVPNPATKSYSHADWVKGKIGDNFGLTLDNNGNIYVATTRVYGTTNLGSATVTPGVPGRGDIYKLDANTGKATRFVQTANSNTYTTGSNKIPNTGPGLGNINYSCDYDNFYVSNFEDGMIYRISSNGTILSRWDHGANLPSATPARPAINDTDNASNSSAPYTQLGRRPWAVQVYGDRLYYSIWYEDIGRPSPILANEVWSIGLDGAGNFTGSARLEITIPPLTGGVFSNPVADISFSPSGKILLAERGMVADNSPGNGGFGAHTARLLEYQGGGPWTPSTAIFRIGFYSSQTNAAGGCDYDNGPGGRVWATGDYLTPTLAYGLQGLPASGGTYANSIEIDLNNVLGTQDKTQVGDVEIPCFQCDSVPPVPKINAPDYTCAASGQYCVAAPVTGVTYTWNVVGGAASPTTGACVTINWYNSIPNKSVAVTATGAYGCSSISRLPLNDCNLYQQDCCVLFNTQVNFKSFIHMGNGVYTLTPTLSVNPTNITRVTADVISSSLTYAPATCGTNGPVNSYITSAPNAPAGFTASLPLTDGREVIWYNSAGASVVNLDFPFQIKFPPPPGGLLCKDFLTFCVRYTFTDRNCKSCEVIRCYGPFQRGGLIKNTGGGFPSS